ncbi:MAG TPA: WhiB family transcriptional regulator, partial [Acidimicrobiales bacterium]|nr:WhiB family transcriptional regulator [Acidimicrobiales bacterium]
TAPVVAPAACRGEPVALFFPQPGLQPIGRSSARTLCAVCPVRRPCADAGRDEPEGLWGGTAPEERHASWVPAAVMERASLA